MNSVLGFEDGEVDLSIPNAIGSTLSTTVSKTANVAVVTGTNDTITIDFPGFASHSITYSAGSNISVAAFAVSISNNYNINGIPVSCTYNSKTHYFTFANTTTNESFTLSGDLLSTLGFD